MESFERELFFLKWEVGALTKKLNNFDNVHSKIDLQTVIFLEQLICTVDTFLKDKVAVETFESQDDFIFDSYIFARSVACKQCYRTIRCSKPDLLQHLQEHVNSNQTNILLQALKGRNEENSTADSTSNKLTQTEMNVPGLKKLQAILPAARKNVKRVLKEPELKANKEYLISGCLPEFTDGLTKKMKKFLKSDPRVFITKRIKRCSEMTNSHAYIAIVEHLEGLLRAEHPCVKAHLFGSRLLGLATEMSDLDIFLDLFSNYNGYVKYSKHTLKDFIVKLESKLNESGQWSQVLPITTARTPILRAWNLQEKMNCDIAFTNGLSHCNTVLVQYFFDLQPVCYLVALYVKEWAQHLNITNLNSYTLTLLTIFYFQEYNLLPSLYTLQKDCDDLRYITKWRTNFSRKSLDELGISLVPESELETYLVGFFCYYGSRFCFETQVVCPFLGWAPLKLDFNPKNDDIPLEMEDFRSFYKSLDMKHASPLYDLLAYKKAMVVQDPIELNHNVAKGLIPTDVSKIKHYFAMTATLLDEKLTKIR